MKKILLLLFFTTFVYSQTANERGKIATASNPSEVKAFNEYYGEYFRNQKNLIEQYKQQHSFVDSEKSTLHRIIDGLPYFISTDNAGSVATLRANAMYPGGTLSLNVTGQGMVAGVWDGGRVRETHQDLTGKITLSDGASTLSAHSTHVTGTVLGRGINPTRRGFAYEASGWTYDWTDDTIEMANFAGNGYLVSNHSYGNIASSLSTSAFGNYNNQAREVDDLMNTYPYYQIVKSAGNDRDTATLSQVNLKGGYDLLSGVSTAKNVITVAAVNEVSSYVDASSVVMSSFSNYGPPDDGRVKPDISAKGVAVFSTNSTSDTAYTGLQGTSMAAPAITGLIVLLQKHYNNVNPTQFMRAASVRGLICQSAREAGAADGPDYEFGWGLADGFNAARIISNNGTSAILEERSLANSAVYTRTFTINTTQNINAAISWTDPTGLSNGTATDNRTPRLINNLDLKITKDGTTYYPWKLDPVNPTNPATNNSDNNADNVEKVEIFNATPGTYTITVSHKGTLTGGNQNYTLIASGTTGLSLNNESFVADNNFFVYPNPANSVLNYTNLNNATVSNIFVTDISGKQVINVNSDVNAIDISALQSGVYFIKFITEDKVIPKKFIKN